MKKHLLRMVALAALGIGLSAGFAEASLISIGIGSTPSTVATDSGSGFVDYISSPTDTSYNVSAQGFPALGFPEANLDTTSVNVSTTHAGSTLYVWVTEQGLSSPLGVSSFLSGFTSNTWTNDVVSVVETTYLSTGNLLFAGAQLATATFTHETDAMNIINTSSALSSPYSETVEYALTMGACSVGHPCTANDTIDISSIPEPVSLAVLGFGLISLGLVRHRRRA
jgi:hypothetical protein